MSDGEITDAERDAPSLTQRRGYAKSSVTKLLSSIQRSTAERNEAKLGDLLVRAAAAFEKFEELHDELCSSLEDHDKIEQESRYFQEINDAYVQHVTAANQVRDQIRAASQDLKVIHDKKELQSADLFGAMNLPRLELSVFSGDVCTFPGWLRVFDEVVDGAKISDAAKLTRMLGATSGPAHAAISACTFLKNGYQEARGILQKRYGDTHAITHKLLAKVRDGGPVKDASGLQQLADDLGTCCRIFQEYGTLSSVESQELIVSIAHKLPAYMQRRWKKEALDTKRERGDYPILREFVKFVQLRAEEEADPLYGSFGGKKSRDARGSAFIGTSTTTNKQKPAPETSKPRLNVPCKFCSDSHKLLFCGKFAKVDAHERLNFVRDNNLCEVCLYDNHNTSSCKRLYTCTICGARHSKLLHVDNVETHKPLPDLNGNASGTNSAVEGKSGEKFLIPTVKVMIADRPAIAVLDTASDTTFCSQSLFNELGLESKSGIFSLNTLNGAKKSMTQFVDLQLKAAEGEHSLLLTNVVVIKEIPLNGAWLDVSVYPHLSDLHIHQPSRKSADLLIGQDNAEALVPLDLRRGNRGEPFAVRTLFGWSINGPSMLNGGGTKGTSHFVSTRCPQDDDHPLDKNLRKMWEIEDDSLRKDRKGPSVEDKRVQALWDETATFREGRFEVPIPWRPDAQLPNNKQMALARLRNTLASLNKRGIREAYHNEIMKLVSQGYAEPVSDKARPDFQWYLPHHVVLSDKKPGKFRIVFDCAARFNGCSLNDACFAGPDLNNRLTDVLLRFRQYPHAFTADVQSMYHQVVIPENERDALRFLWQDPTGQINTFRMTRHLFGGVWCASSATYALRKSISIAKQVSHSTSSAILRSFYVDDCLHSAPSQEELIGVAGGIVNTLQHAGFDLVKFVSNSPKLKTSTAVKEIAAFDQHVLGVRWNVSDDSFHFSPKEAKIATRRHMSMVSLPPFLTP